MKKFKYERKAQFTGKLEEYIGIFDEKKSSQFNFVKIYRPIINGHIMWGICHTNAENIIEL